MLVSIICTIFYVESVLKIFASFTVIMYVSNMHEHIYLPYRPGFKNRLMFQDVTG